MHAVHKRSSPFTCVSPSMLCSVAPINLEGTECTHLKLPMVWRKLAGAHPVVHRNISGSLGHHFQSDRTPEDLDCSMLGRTSMQGSSRRQGLFSPQMQRCAVSTVWDVNAHPATPVIGRSVSVGRPSLSVMSPPIVCATGPQVVRQSHLVDSAGDVAAMRITLDRLFHGTRWIGALVIAARIRVVLHRLLAISAWIDTYSCRRVNLTAA